MKEINSFYLKLIKNLNKKEYVLDDIGKKYKEIMFFKMTKKINGSNDLLITLKDRKLNYVFNLIEKLCYITGIGIEKGIIDKYNKNYGFVYENRMDIGNYGWRIYMQFDQIYKKLLENNGSRQAVITIYNNLIDLNRETVDIPCTLNLIFLIRNNKLHFTALMRSNDINWGFPYDISQFSFIQEVMASLLNLKLGYYTHFCNSLHLYENAEHKLSNLSIEENNQFQPKFDINNFDLLKEKLNDFWEYENQLRNGNIFKKFDISNFFNWAYGKIYNYWLKKYNGGN